MGAAILNFCFLIVHKPLFFSAPALAHDLFFRKATGAPRDGRCPILALCWRIFLKIVTTQEVCSVCARKPLHFSASPLALLRRRTFMLFRQRQSDESYHCDRKR